MDIESAKKGKSVCRNEAIAEAFHYMHIVEAWGTGLPRIINRCKEYGLSEPLFEEFGDGFKITIFRKSNNGRLFEINEHIHVRQENEYVIEHEQESEQESEQVIQNLIIEFCRKPRTTSEILDHFKMGRSYFKRHFQDRMLKDGILKMTEPDNVKSKNQKYYS